MKAQIEAAKDNEIFPMCKGQQFGDATGMMREGLLNETMQPALHRTIKIVEMPIIRRGDNDGARGCHDAGGCVGWLSARLC